MSFLAIRTVASLWSALIGIGAIWLSVPELIRPHLGYFPSDRQEAATFSAAENSAAWAASIAGTRGDLWANAAVTEAAPFLFEQANVSTAETSQAEFKAAMDAAVRAAHLSPHDSRVWLVLAALEVRGGRPGPKASEALKLSFLTGPNEFSLMPLRLRVAASAVLDEQVEDLLRSELQRILLNRPQLKPAIEQAYKLASRATRRTFEAVLKEIDPKFFTEISSAPQQ